MTAGRKVPRGRRATQRQRSNPRKLRFFALAVRCSTLPGKADPGWIVKAACSVMQSISCAPAAVAGPPSGCLRRVQAEVAKWSRESVPSCRPCPRCRSRFPRSLWMSAHAPGRALASSSPVPALAAAPATPVRRQMCSMCGPTSNRATNPRRCSRGARGCAGRWSLAALQAEVLANTPEPALAAAPATPVRAPAVPTDAQAALLQDLEEVSLGLVGNALLEVVQGADHFMT